MTNINYVQSKYIDFTVPVYAITFRFTQRHPPVLPAYSNITLPFKLIVWLGIFLSLVTATIFYVLIRMYAYKITVYGNLQIFLPYTMLMGQGVSMAHKSQGVFIFLMTWLCMTTIINYSYRGNLLASLVQTQRERPYDTIKDLVDRKIILHTMPEAVILQQWRFSTNPYHRHRLLKS